MLKKNPKEVGQNIVSKLESSPVVSKVELSGPGFINITLSESYIQKQVSLFNLKKTEVHFFYKVLGLQIFNLNLFFANFLLYQLIICFVFSGY